MTSSPDQTSGDVQPSNNNLPGADGNPNVGGGGDLDKNYGAANTFRKRRLSLPLHELARMASSLPEEPEEPEAAAEDKGQSFRKRRLSLNLHKRRKMEDDDDDDEHKKEEDREQLLTARSHQPPPSSSSPSLHRVVSPKRAGRRSSEPQPAPRLTPKTIHAPEIVDDPLADLDGSQHALYGSLPVLYDPVALEHAAHQRALWQTRHEPPTDEARWPFPRTVVATYSCHGREPIYEDGAYEPEDEDEDDDDADEFGEDTAAPPAPAPATATTAPVDTIAATILNHDSQVQQPQQQVEEAEDVSEVPPLIVAKINQDRGGVVFPYANSPRTALFAVYDGHGQGGELVSQYALAEVPRRLDKHPAYPTDLKKAFTDVFLGIDQDLATEPLIEPVYSGTTACVALLRENKLTVSNAGDSRAVLARRLEDGGSGYTAVDLSQDQNPDMPGEKERILEAGGFVTLSTEGASSRVWLDPACEEIGLAMARSIGDHAVKPVGVIAEPVVTHHTIVPQDDFMILASDGVWEFLSSQEAIEVVAQHLQDGGGATKACQALIETAATKWHEEEGEYRDDITAIVVRLQELWKTHTPKQRTGSI